MTQPTPDHSTISKTRRRLPLSVHTAVFTKVLEILAGEKLLRGKKIGVDATTLQANASMRALTHNVSGNSYREDVKSLMAEDPEEPDDPSPEDIARFDRRRKGKKLSHKHWKNPHNPDAKVTKMKDGRTHFAEKCEQAVDPETGAVVAVTLQGAELGDTTTMEETLKAAATQLEAVGPALDKQRQDEPRRPGRPPKREVIQCVVADKGYHSAAVCAELLEESIRPMISEPKTGRRKWKGKERQQKAFYANRVHIRSQQGKGWLRKRAASWSSGPLPTISTRAGCAGSGSRDMTTSSSGLSCRWPASIWACSCESLPERPRRGHWRTGQGFAGAFSSRFSLLSAMSAPSGGSMIKSCPFSPMTAQSRVNRQKRCPPLEFFKKRTWSTAS